jgi:hypothetical protein
LIFKDKFHEGDDDVFKALQDFLNENVKLSPDGDLGHDTVAALQYYLNHEEYGSKTKIKIDGDLGSDTVRHLQAFLNANSVVTTTLESIEEQSSEWIDSGHPGAASLSCSACDSSSSVTCGSTFVVKETRTVTTESKEINELGGEIEWGGDVKFEVLGIGVTVPIPKISLSYSHTWEESKSEATQYEMSMQADCSASAKPHSNLSLEVYYRTGILNVSATITSSTKDICGGTQDKTYDASISISNLAVYAEDLQCTVSDAKCANADFHV